MRRKDYRLQSQSGSPKSSVSSRKQQKLPQLSRYALSQKFTLLQSETNSYADYVKFFTTKTLQGYVGSTQHNQDKVFFQTKLCENDERYLFGVCDGHGIDGHQISYYVAHQYKNKLQEKLSVELYFGDHQQQSMKLMNQCANEIESELQHQNKFDTLMSGATLLSLLINGDQMICQNIGNSRAVMFSRAQSQWEYKELTSDHKVSQPKECQRILQNGGKIEQLRNEFTHKKQGPYYIFHEDQHIPGLQATRSLGDQMGKKIGVIAESQFAVYTIESVGFVLIGTCGLWDIVNYLEIAEQLEKFKVVTQQKQIEELANQLLFYCKKKWEYCYNSNEVVKIEDISFIIIYVS